MERRELTDQEYRKLGQMAYCAWQLARGELTMDSPAFRELPEREQAAWQRAACVVVRQAGFLETTHRPETRGGLTGSQQTKTRS